MPNPFLQTKLSFDDGEIGVTTPVLCRIFDVVTVVITCQQEKYSED